MLVLTLTDCPPALRGDLTKWLQEIDTGVYVGHVSARVREELWKKVCDNAKCGRATIVFSARNEQRMDFRVHNARLKPIDFDGFKLMLRPAPAFTPVAEVKPSHSNASKMHMARAMSGKPRRKSPALERYAVIDLETTGLSPEHDEIIEVGALIVCAGQIEAEFQELLRPKARISPEIERLTGLTGALLEAEGKTLQEVMPAFLQFIGPLPVISHNAEFDCNFLRAACGDCELPLFSNPSIDTCELARRTVKDVPDCKLQTLAEHFQLTVSAKHRSLADCLTTKQLYEKLNEMRG
ncbi:type I-E CRISPR-associated endoribonuclease Cas2e [Bacillota bacterium Meth-B3]